jgi:hypothetical protein
MFAYSIIQHKALKELANYYEMPGDLGHSVLRVRDNAKTRRKTLAWMTGGGVLTHELDPLALIKFSAFTPQSDLLKRLISEAGQEVIGYPAARDDYWQEGQDLPIGMAYDGWPY